MTVYLDELFLLNAALNYLLLLGSARLGGGVIRRILSHTESMMVSASTREKLFFTVLQSFLPNFIIFSSPSLPITLFWQSKYN